VVHFLRRFGGTLRSNWRAAPAPVFVGVLLLTPSLVFLLTGRNYNSRYVIGQYPLVFLLPGLFFTEAAPVRWRKLVWGAAAVTVGFNLILVPAFFRYQGAQIMHGECFVPSFRHMEQVRQKLITDAGPARRVRVECSAFTGNKHDPRNLGAWALARYVDVTEQYERGRQGTSAIQVYQALPVTNLVDSGGDVVYQGHGIALKKVPVSGGS
jgi:hypothetical protein